MKKLVLISILCLGLTNGFGQDIELGGNTVPTSTIPVISVDCNTATYTLNPVISLPCAQFSDYSAVRAIPYNPPSPLDSGTVVNMNGDDLFSGAISLPFNFVFYGTSYSQITISANGFVSFNIQNAGQFCHWNFRNNNNIPNQTMYAELYNAIYGVIQDIDFHYAGSIKYSTIGTAPNRAFCVSFYEVPLYQCGNLQSSQIVLYESTNVIDVYIQNRDICSWNSGRGVVGIQNSNGAKGLAPQGRNLEDAWSVSTPEAWRFLPDYDDDYSIVWQKSASGEVLGTDNNLTLNRGLNEQDTITATLSANGLTVSDSVVIDWGIRVTTLYDTIPAEHDEFYFGDINLSQSGTYTQTVTGSNGCDSIIVLHLIVLPLAPVNISLSSGNVSSENGSIIITWENAPTTQQIIRQRAPNEQHVFYKIYRNGEFLTETTEQRYEDTGVTVGENYCYKVQIFISENVGSNYSEQVCAVVSALNEILANNLQIYPNPATTELRIESGDLKIGDKVEIYDITGKLQLLSTVDFPLSIIDVSALSSGVYFVKIGNSNGKFIKK